MQLTASFYTVADMYNFERLSRIEEILDLSSMAWVKKIDVRDPLRNSVEKFAGGFTGCLKRHDFKRWLWILAQSGRERKNRFSMQLILKPYGKNQSRQADLGFSDIFYDLTRPEMSADDLRDFQELFGEVANALDAFYARAGETSMITQRNDLLLKAPGQLGIRKFPVFDLELPDVYWLNYFGPGYRYHWGQAKIEQLRERYGLTEFDNQAFCVRTTPEPMAADPEVTHLRGYGFKQAMYEALGVSTFMHEGQVLGRPGEYVPTLEDHRLLLRRRERQSATN